MSFGRMARRAAGGGCRDKIDPARPNLRRATAAHRTAGGVNPGKARLPASSRGAAAALNGEYSPDIPVDTAKSSHLLRAAALALAAVLAACVVVPADPHYGPAPVMVAPPPPQGEVIGVAPAPGYFWIGGYWNWAGGAYAWHPGHWEAHRAGYYWVPHQWVHGGGGWYARPGHWQPH